MLISKFQRHSLRAQLLRDLTAFPSPRQRRLSGLSPPQPGAGRASPNLIFHRPDPLNHRPPPGGLLLSRLGLANLSYAECVVMARSAAIA